MYDCASILGPQCFSWCIYTYISIRSFFWLYIRIIVLCAGTSKGQPIIYMYVLSVSSSCEVVNQ